MSEQHATENMANEIISTALAGADLALAAGFVDVQEPHQISRQAWADSEHWSNYFFSSEASPHSPALKIARSFHVAGSRTPDLLRHDYEAGGLELRVVESANYTLIFVEKPGILETPANQRKAAVDTTAHAVLRMEDRRWSELAHVWKFDVPEHIEEGTRFTTNKSIVPLWTGSWINRVDAGVHKGRLFFLCYKHTLSMAAPLDDRHWFEPEFRAKHGTSSPSQQ